MDVVFRSGKLNLINVINDIVEEYRGYGFMLTARQIYYRLVVTNVIENDEKNYKIITKLINDGKLAGYIDWDMIEDRTRGFKGRQHWTSPSGILSSAARSYHEDMWNEQDYRLFAIVEKDALFGVLNRACYKYDVPLLSARGYPSGTALREFVEGHVLSNSRQHIHIIHLGDHDPSGLDMTRDLEERIAMFCFGEVDRISLTRIALNMDQIADQKPPPNPAKITDSRAKQYMRTYGQSSWELDALNPMYLDRILSEEIEKYIDFSLWNEKQINIMHTQKHILDFTETFK